MSANEIVIRDSIEEIHRNTRSNKKKSISNSKFYYFKIEIEIEISGVVGEKNINKSIEVDLNISGNNLLILFFIYLFLK